MLFKKGLTVVFALITSASIYYIQATDSKTQESTYARFASSYESLFKEAPAHAWSEKEESCRSCKSCSGCDTGC